MIWKFAFVAMLFLFLICMAVSVGYGLDHPDETAARIFINTFPWSMVGPIAGLLASYFWSNLDDDE